MSSVVSVRNVVAVWTVIVYGVCLKCSSDSNKVFFVSASIDPSSSSSHNTHHHGSTGSSSSSNPYDFIYSQSYQLDYTNDQSSLHNAKKNTNYRPSFDVWKQKFNSKVEQMNFEELISDNDHDDDDDDDSDTDQDDGHSSMLSIISLRRKQRPSSSQQHWMITTSQIKNDHSSSNHHQHRTISKKKVRKTSAALMSRYLQQHHHPHQSVFRVGRGGASSSVDSGIISSNWMTHWFVVAYQSQVGRNLIVSAIVTLVFEAMIGHILEFLKIVMQTSSSTSELTYVQVIQTITADKGIMGLWDGFCPWGIVQAVCKGAVFGLAHATALQTLKPLAEQKIIPMALALTLAGGIGGGFQGYILSPTLLLKTRVMTNPVFREKMSALRTTLLSFTIGYDVVQKEGLGALMKGANVFATKRVFDWASRYYFADLFEDLFTQLRHGSKLSVAEKSAASLLGGVFSTLVTLPLDVLVAKTQDAKKAGIAVSPIKLFQDELREKGWNGIRNAYMRGFEARLLHVCLTTVVIKTGTPIAYEAIFGSS